MAAQMVDVSGAKTEIASAVSTVALMDLLQAVPKAVMKVETLAGMWE